MKLQVAACYRSVPVPCASTLIKLATYKVVSFVLSVAPTNLQGVQQKVEYLMRADGHDGFVHAA